MKYNDYQQFIVGKINYDNQMKKLFEKSKKKLLNLFYNLKDKENNLEIDNFLFNNNFIIRKNNKFYCNIPIYTIKQIKKVNKLSKFYSNEIFEITKKLFYLENNDTLLHFYIIISSLILDLFVLKYLIENKIINYNNKDNSGNNFLYFIEEKNQNSDKLLKNTERIKLNNIWYCTFGYNKKINNKIVWVLSKILNQGKIKNNELNQFNNFVLCYLKNKNKKNQTKQFKNNKLISKKLLILLKKTVLINNDSFEYLNKNIKDYKNSIIKYIISKKSEIENSFKSFTNLNFNTDFFYIWHYIFGNHNIILLNYLNKKFNLKQTNIFNFIIEHDILNKILIN